MYTRNSNGPMTVPCGTPDVYLYSNTAYAFAGSARCVVKKGKLKTSSIYICIYMYVL